jgi:hypothetical protein
MSQQVEERKIESVYEPIKQFYRDNPSLEYFPDSLSRGKVFWDVVCEGQPVTKHIQYMIRIKIGDSQKIFYYEDLISSDFLGNERIFNWIVGRYDLPVAHKEIIDGEIVVTSIEKLVTTYDIPYTPENIQNLLPYCDDSTRYFVEESDTRYTSNKKDFCQSTFEYAVANRPAR